MSPRQLKDLDILDVPLCKEDCLLFLHLISFRIPVAG